MARHSGHSCSTVSATAPDQRIQIQLASPPSKVVSIVFITIGELNLYYFRLSASVRKDGATLHPCLRQQHKNVLSDVGNNAHPQGLKLDVAVHRPTDHTLDPPPPLSCHK